MSIIAMKRKARKNNPPISRGNFSLYGTNSTKRNNVSKCNTVKDNTNNDQNQYILDKKRSIAM